MVTAFAVAFPPDTTSFVSLRQFKGQLFINEQPAPWESAFTLIEVKGRFVGPGMIYTNQDIREVIREECFRKNKAEISAQPDPQLKIDYCEVNLRPYLGSTDQALADLISVMVRSEYEAAALKLTTHHIPQNRPTRRM